MIFTDRLKCLIDTFFKSKKPADIEMRCGSVQKPGDKFLPLQKPILNVFALRKIKARIDEFPVKLGLQVALQGTEIGRFLGCSRAEKQVWAARPVG